MVFGEQQFRGVRHLPQSRLLHFVDAQFRRGAEAVLDASQDAVHIMLVTFKLDDGIHDVLQNLRSCQRALLRDVAYQYDGHTARLGEAQQCRGTFANLSNRAGTRLDILGGDGLNGVDDHHVGLCLTDMVEDGFEGIFAEDEEIIGDGIADNGAGREALGTHFQLVGAFLTADVEHALLWQSEHRLQR